MDKAIDHLQKTIGERAVLKEELDALVDSHEGIERHWFEYDESEQVYYLTPETLAYEAKPKEDFEALIIVKACNIEYKKSAHLEDELTVRSFVKSITKTSFFMNQIITRGDEIIVEAQVHLVFVDKKGKPVKIPDKIYSKFKPFFCDTIKT